MHGLVLWDYRAMRIRHYVTVKYSRLIQTNIGEQTIAKPLALEVASKRHTFLVLRSWSAMFVLSAGYLCLPAASHDNAPNSPVVINWILV